MGPKTLEGGSEMFERGKRSELLRERVCLREKEVKKRFERWGNKKEGESTYLKMAWKGSCERGDFRKWGNERHGLIKKKREVKKGF